MYDVDHDDPPEAVQRALALLERTTPTAEQLEEMEERRRANRIERIMAAPTPPPPQPSPVIRKVQENAMIQNPKPKPVTLAVVRREALAASNALLDGLLDVLLPKIQAALDNRATLSDLTALGERVAALEKPKVRVKAEGERWPA